MNNSSQGKEKLSLSPSQIRQLKHHDLFSKLSSLLEDSLIMNNLVFNQSGKYHIGSILFDDEGKIYEETNLSDTLRDPVDVSGDLSKFDILKLKDQLFQLVDQY